MGKKRGKQTFALAAPPYLAGAYTIAGTKEGEGPLGECFDQLIPDALWGETTWEKTESKLMTTAVRGACQRADWTEGDAELLLAGDLLNQTISANFSARALGIPFFGIFGACSTMAEGLGLGAMLIDGGYVDRLVATASSHHETAERQFRSPNELGVQRPPEAQWTVTGAGAAALASPAVYHHPASLAGRSAVTVTHVTVGKVVDLGVKDAGDMGSAMAPAAAHTILTHLHDTERTVGDYDAIVTGDLGHVGHAACRALMAAEGVVPGERLLDCGVMIFDASRQDTHAGGSGCGCSAVVILSELLRRLRDRCYRRLLFVGTGALFSPMSSQQGESIPAIGHAVVLERGE
ncbi:stage V sporulation protein AD [Heliophilum fasciatum]|uniref:Stage V sporulation protein AD n=1 Tax=Heliophilum fasciatum TaxID=35700 RepID=A0A4R2RUY1_9FIRM|nr:stage V sporulation protein AD [Heliophilum fasciatum]MCW2277368.1 stage V sporulation protein AD [Heliophilum fasciatum]TCP67204.1 stage V sporulation protein AD [Heliophilum fasciatum]